MSFFGTVSTHGSDLFLLVSTGARSRHCFTWISSAPALQLYSKPNSTSPFTATVPYWPSPAPEYTLASESLRGCTHNMTHTSIHKINHYTAVTDRDPIGVQNCTGRRPTLYPLSIPLKTPSSQSPALKEGYVVITSNIPVNRAVTQLQGNTRKQTGGGG